MDTSQKSLRTAGKGLYQPLYDLGRKDIAAIERIHHIELWVGNAKQAAYYYRQAYGFELLAYAGPETGVRDRASYMLQSGDVRLVLTTALGPDSPISAHHLEHGDGVSVVTYQVPNARSAFEILVERGAEPEMDPTTFKDENGEVEIAGIKAFGDTSYRLVSMEKPHRVFLPGYETRQESPIIGVTNNLTFIDHMVTNVEDGRMEHWVDWYKKVFGFSVLAHFDENDISTEYSSLRSKVMTNNDGLVKIPINEPAEGKMKSQIQEYIDYYRSPGVQHIALATDDIIGSVAQMRQCGVEFLNTPDSYYKNLEDRIGKIDEDIDALRRLGILVDRDDKGYLLQVFTQPVEDRPTMFFEIIQRKGSLSFGKGNFKALFESLEEEQRSRGNL
ncbi:MAG: 4-hydroxyphenylpyruvate dioxygenase [Calditrichaeota bacterium]|nr:4-hydroxyphenylpyruvate dioxygenase [Calditrichota bacterium]